MASNNLATQRCDALRRNGHPCRGYGRYVAYGGALCHIHKHFFDDPSKAYQLIERNASIFQTLKEREWSVAMLRSPLCMGTQAREMALYVIEGLRKLLASNDWYLKHKADYMYTVFLHAGLLKPSQMPDLWRRGVHRQLRVLQYCANEQTITPQYRQSIQLLLVPYFKHADPEFAVRGLLAAMAMPTVATNTPAFRAADVSGQMWREVIELCFSELKMRPFAMLNVDTFLDEILDYQRERHPDSTLLRQEMANFVRATLRAHRDAERAKLRRGTAPFKEHLAAHAFRPARVEQALAAGLEVEDL